MAKYPERGFLKNADHFAPDYFTAVKVGIPGLFDRIERSIVSHSDEPDKVEFLYSMKETLCAFCDKLQLYADKAEELFNAEGYEKSRLQKIRENCITLINSAPQTFEQGLQLVWMLHICFVSEGRYAMALGRIDRYLYPLYERDINNGLIDEEYAEELLSNVFAKICERRYTGGDDVVNICIGGVDEDGICSVNGLSYRVLHAVRDVNMPGPNLSARITADCPDKFLDECLKVIGTGLGYPALMNDDVNMAALARKGYDIKDVRNYCMVGCIENFITGKQPPWVDGRFDPIKYLLAIFERNDDDALDNISSMDEFMAIYKENLAEGACDYVKCTRAASYVADPENHTSPFMSCFCDFCIERGLDINMGGSKYPSVHGAVLMGIGTVSDCLSAIEKTVYIDKTASLSVIKEAINNNFEGFEELRKTLLEAPKYGNNDGFADKYGVWYTNTLSDMFDGYTTNDGGAYYTAMAANISNIDAGRHLSATPDGRLAGKPLSDAASPTYGCDIRGVTSTLLSVSKPDYTRCACGTVVNQKFSPDAFKDGKRDKLLQLIRVYFSRGGQEIQINSTSRQVLQDAMDHPEKYPSLVVRVSGFSAIYITLSKEVQEDILSRTQQTI
jgi:formate C-acetyltransferase